MMFAMHPAQGTTNCPVYLPFDEQRLAALCRKKTREKSGNLSIGGESISDSTWRAHTQTHEHISHAEM